MVQPSCLDTQPLHIYFEVNRAEINPSVTHPRVTFVLPEKEAYNRRKTTIIV